MLSMCDRSQYDYGSTECSKEMCEHVPLQQFCDYVKTLYGADRCRPAHSMLCICKSYQSVNVRTNQSNAGD